MKSERITCPLCDGTGVNILSPGEPCILCNGEQVVGNKKWVKFMVMSKDSM